MRHSTLIFVVAAFALLTLSRLALAAWQWQRVRNAGGLFPLLLGGLRIDAHQIAVLAALPAALSPLLGHFPIAATITGYWYLIAFLLLAFLEVATPPFIVEYDTRPNRLFVEYLKHPREVSGMLWRGYKLALLGGLGGLAVIGWARSACSATPSPTRNWPGGRCRLPSWSLWPSPFWPYAAPWGIALSTRRPSPIVPTACSTPWP